MRTMCLFFAHKHLIHQMESWTHEPFTLGDTQVNKNSNVLKSDIDIMFIINI